MIHPTINVQLIDMRTTKCNELVTENADGSYTILINARMTVETQAEAYLHALRHIGHGDFERRNADKIEVINHVEARARRKDAVL